MKREELRQEAPLGPLKRRINVIMSKRGHTCGKIGRFPEVELMGIGTVLSSMELVSAKERHMVVCDGK